MSISTMHLLSYNINNTTQQIYLTAMKDYTRAASFIKQQKTTRRQSTNNALLILTIITNKPTIMEKYKMSKICELLRDMMKDEKKAPSDYEKIKVKMLGHPDKKKIISEIQDDERDHYKKVREMAEELGCNCDKQ